MLVRGQGFCGTTFPTASSVPPPPPPPPLVEVDEAKARAEALLNAYAAELGPQVTETALKLLERLTSVPPGTWVSVEDVTPEKIAAPGDVIKEAKALAEGTPFVVIDDAKWVKLERVQDSEFVGD